MPSTLGADQRLKKQGHQAVHIVVGHEDDIATLATITTIRAATRDELFAAKAAATITSITRFGMHADLIDKFHARKVADMTGQVELELESEGVLSVENRSIECYDFNMSTSPSIETLRDLDRQYHLHPFTNHLDMHQPGTHLIKSGDGCHLIDENDRRLLDGLAGLWCVNVGYSCAPIVKAVEAQMTRLPFYPSFFNTTTEPPIRVAEFLAKKAPARVNRTVFSNSGSEANETALKLIRSFHKLRGQPGKKKILSRTFSYHGVTLATSSLTGLPTVYEPFDLPLPGFIHVPGPHTYGYNSPMDAEAFGRWCLEETARIIREEGPETIAAMFVEPIQGAGGVIPPPPGYLSELRELLRKNDILFVADEVITAFGRIGDWFASTLWNLDPDIITLAKGITSGYLPLGATMVSDEIAETVFKGGYFAHGFTYSGHPTSAAAALANLETIENLGLIERVRDDVGPYFQKKLHAFASHPAVGEIRGHMLIGAIELLPKGGREAITPATSLGIPAAAHIRNEGSIVRGIRNLIAVAPPLIITHTEIDELFASIERGLEKLWE
jgi:putrescine aminotransferase